MGSPKTLHNKWIERRSAAGEEFLRLVVDTIPALVVSVLSEGSVDFVNKGSRDYTGLPLERLTGWGWNTVIRQAYLSEAERLSHTGGFGWKPDSCEIVWSDETYPSSSTTSQLSQL